MKKISDFRDDLKGIEFLRSLVMAFNSRDEHLNDNKTPIELVHEYLNHLNDEIDINGNKLS